MRRSPSNTIQQRVVERALERLADALLMQSLREDGRGEYPFYSLRWEKRSAFRDEALRGNHELSPAQPQRDLSKLVPILSRRLDLSVRERTVLTWLAQGYSPRQVDAMLGLDAGRTAGVIRSVRRVAAARELTADECLLRPDDIDAVFREECARTDYHDERHCPAGQEACRRTGKCARRWYLRFAS